MIGYLEGTLFKRIEEDRIILLVNQVGFEVVLPTMVMTSVEDAEVGTPISLYIFYHQTERQPKPVLIGFTTEEQKAFFQLLISVEDIGPLKAVKALDRPVQEIAAAIESGNRTKLNQLKGIGARTAQKIIASLQGKMDPFISPQFLDDGVRAMPEDRVVQQVMDVLVRQLGHKAAEAKRMIQKAVRRNRSISSSEELFDEVYRGDEHA